MFFANPHSKLTVRGKNMSTLYIKKIEDIVREDQSFVIPSYQRWYKWGKEEVKLLIDDISKGESEYCLQTLVLKENKDSSFNVVDGQQRLRTINLMLGEKINLRYENRTNKTDEYYLNEAKKIIENNEVDIEKINKSFFLVYILDKDQDEKKFFQGINDLKIPLSSAELFKGILLESEDKTLINEWNRCSSILRDDGFWNFYCLDRDSKRYYASRWDFILELLYKENQESIKTKYEKNPIFIFNDLINTDYSKAKEIFEQAVQYVDTLKNWYDNKAIHNTLGFFLNSWFFGKSQSFDLLAEVLKDTKYLHNSFMKTLKEWKNNELRYGENDKEIKDVLLICDLVQINTLYDFAKVQNQSWSIEHIHARNEKLPEDIDDIYKDLNDISAKEKLKELYNNGNGDPSDFWDAYYKEVGGVQNDDEDFINSMKNLALLESNLNSKFNNSSFKQKREKAIECQFSIKKTEEIYCSDEYKEIKAWGEEEGKKHLESITNLVKKFIDNEPTLSLCKKRDFSNCNCSPSCCISNSKSNTIEPKMYSLSELLKDHQIIIPAMQREYAEGRSNEKTNIKEILTLYRDYFGGTKNSYSLDFVYGTINQNNELIVIDGQQRVTTLFLLYALFYNGDRTFLKNFSYKSRISADEFCKELVESRCIPSICNDESSDTMKTMLCNIDKEMKNVTEEKLDAIKFNLLLDPRITKDAYWKLNARGKRLTLWEVFKAKLETTLSKLDKQLQEKFSSKIDNSWFELFLQKGQEPDSHLLSFFLKMIYFHLIDQSYEDHALLENIKNVFTEKATYLDYLPLEQYLIAHKDKSRDFFNKLFTFLDWLKTNYRNFKHYISSCKFNNEKDAIDIIFDNKRNSRLMLYALSKAYDKKLNLERFSRRSYNIIYNTNDEYTKASKTYPSMIALKYLSECEDFSKGEIPSTLEKNSIAYTMLQEEIEKAKAIQNKRINETKIIEAERYAFFDGRISFLFHKSVDELCWDDFESKLAKAKEYFDEDGVKTNKRSEFITFIIKTICPMDEYVFTHHADYIKNLYLHEPDRFEAIHYLLTLKDLDHCKLEKKEAAAFLKMPIEEILKKFDFNRGSWKAYEWIVLRCKDEKHTLYNPYRWEMSLDKEDIAIENRIIEIVEALGYKIHGEDITLSSLNCHAFFRGDREITLTKEQSPNINITGCTSYYNPAIWVYEKDNQWKEFPYDESSSNQLQEDIKKYLEEREYEQSNS